MSPVLVDTGFLVALFRPGDRLRAAALTYLQAHTHPLVTVAPVIVETCFFLDPPAKADLLSWAHRGAIGVIEAAVESYPRLGAIIRKYGDREVDLADAALLWLADEIGERKILTVDVRDFEVYRLKGNKRFDVIAWGR